MANIHDPLIRQWSMLRSIPRYPGKITARELTNKLEAENFQVSKRTVERDLMELSGSFPLQLDERSKPFGWSWQKDAPAFDLPGISNNEALTLVMVEQYISELLPSNTLEVLEPYFKNARQQLNKNQASGGLHEWVNKVATIAPTQALIPPPIHAGVKHTVSEALLKNRQLTIQYRKKGRDECEDYRIHPLAIVQRGPIVYLFVRFYDFQDTRMLAMHRIADAQLLTENTVFPDNFDLRNEIVNGRFDFGNGGNIDIQIKLSEQRGEHLYESKLSENQIIKENADGTVTVTATVADTSQLRWWILGLGDGAEVILPQTLRDEIASTVESMHQRYWS